MQEARALHLKDRIEKRIATGVYAPGERLEETTLAQQFGVSRTPVREALQQLAATGLVELRGRRGAIVSSPDATRLLEMLEVMGEFEAMCGRLAARRLTPAEEEVLTQALQACKDAAKTGDPDAYFIANERFHHTIYVASGNRFLEEQTSNLYKRLAPFRRLQLRIRNRIQSSIEEHQEIVAAIIRGDCEGAEDSLRHHVSIQGERLSDLISTIEREKIGMA